MERGLCAKSGYRLSIRILPIRGKGSHSLMSVKWFDRAFDLAKDVCLIRPVLS